MRLTTFIALALLGAQCAAEETVSVYRSTGDEGEIVYSDEPRPGAVRMELVLPERAPAGASGAPAGESRQSVAASEHYSTFTIREPAPGATIRANTGNVPLVLDVQPGLRAGHRVRAYLDGEPLEVDSPSMLLENVPRGAHRLRAEIVDDQGKVLAKAGPVEFDLLRISRLTKPTGPDQPGGADRPPSPVPGGPGPTSPPDLPGGAVRQAD